MDAATPLVASRYLTGRPGLTNFYPAYDGANDQVDPVLPVRKTIFQRVIPRYRLSTSETRDEGLGPAFVESAYLRAPAGRESSASGSSGKSVSPKPQPAPLKPGTGSLVDIYA
jgi:hypothetical protein